MTRFILTLLFSVYTLSAQNQGSVSEQYPFEKEILHFEAMDQDSFPPEQAVLFVGSSSIRMWKTVSEDMDPIPVINRGFGGSQAHHVLHYMNRIVFPYKPLAIVFYEGDNDIASGKLPSQFVDECEVFMDSVKQRLPGVPVFFLSPKPSYARINLESVRKEACRLLEDFCQKTDSAEYIDVETAMFGPDGDLRKDIFIEDQLHMNAEGYKIWTDIIKARLMEIVNKS